MMSEVIFPHAFIFFILNRNQFILLENKQKNLVEGLFAKNAFLQTSGLKAAVTEVATHVSGL